MAKSKMEISIKQKPEPIKLQIFALSFLTSSHSLHPAEICLIPPLQCTVFNNYLLK
jgi:hypothetical protein